MRACVRGWMGGERCLWGMNQNSTGVLFPNKSLLDWITTENVKLIGLTVRYSEPLFIFLKTEDRPTESSITNYVDII